SATFRGDSSKIEIGDYLNMKLVVNAQPGIVIDFPKFPGDTIGKIAIVKKDKIDTAKIGSSTIYSQNLTIQAYEDGRYIFEPLKVYFLNKSTGVVDTAYTNAWELIVTTVPVDTTKPIKPIKAPLNVPYQIREFYWWIAGGLAFVALIIIGILLYFHYRKKPKPVAARPRPKDPAHIWAYKELKKLDDEKLWQKDQIKLYHSRLTDILRSYLEFRYDYYALESTTEEIQTELDRLEIKMDAAAKLMETLRLADFVKFAKMSPAPDENMKSMQNALSFIDQTKLLVAEPQTPNNKPKPNNNNKKRK
ncbi:MAG: Oxygen tolerance, partial [Bacteroidetes bacterium]|nr:Oxygen tolerance [Bacteroidota bacterium]